MVYTLGSGVGGAVEQLTRRKLVTIDGSKVASETAIPLMLNINLPGVKTGGADVRFAKLDGTPIAREIECKDVPNTDDVALHFPFDTISGTDSQFYVYWAPGSALTEPAANSTYGSQAVWDSNYVSVWHMNNNPNGDAANSIKDSTSNANHGTPSGTMTSADLVDTSYGKGIDFDGSNDAITAPNTLNVNTVTIEAKLSVGGKASAFRGIFGSTGWASGDLHFQFLTDDKCSYGIKSGTTGYGVVSTTLFNSDEYDIAHILAGVYDGGADTLKVYVDSNNEATTSSHPSQTINTSSPRMAAVYDNNRFFDGIMEELRISKSVRSTNFLTTTHKNLKNPTAAGTTPFYKSFGLAQHQRIMPRFV